MTDFGKMLFREFVNVERERLQHPDTVTPAIGKDLSLGAVAVAIAQYAAYSIGAEPLPWGELTETRREFYRLLALRAVSWLEPDDIEATIKLAVRDCADWNADQHTTPTDDERARQAVIYFIAHLAKPTGGAL